MIAPPPFRQYCPACGWTGDVIAPKSDAFSPADMAQVRETCPTCGKGDLEIKKGKILSGWLSRFFGK